MSQFRIVVTEIGEPYNVREITANETSQISSLSQLGSVSLCRNPPENEVFRQVISDLDIRKFVRQVNSSPRRSRKATKGASVS